MAQPTEQERAEYLSWISANYADIYSAEEAQMMWDHGHLSALAWKEQASRRAQVVPQGWSLQDAAQDALDWLEDEDLNMTHNIRERLRFALADAPQPTKAAKYCNLCKDEGGYYYGRTGYEPCCVNAAPQPPEGVVNDSLTAEAAPAQLPDPAASAYMSEPKDDGTVCTEMMVNPGLCTPGWNMLYTEHQVRQLLAAHGVK